MDKAVFSPRANVRYNPTADVNLRLSYAEGFRAPQAFDEDLHISNVGGARVSIVRDPESEGRAFAERERVCRLVSLFWRFPGEYVTGRILYEIE